MEMKLSISAGIFAMIITVCMLSCANNVASNTSENQDSFRFDSLVHYSTGIDLYKIGELAVKSNKSEKDVFLLSVLEDNQVDTSIVNRLAGVNYTKTLVMGSLYRSIDSLFFHKKRQDNIETSCIHEFRDILVFYKDKKCIGLAKICFSCKATVVWNGGIPFKGFGDWDDYDKLYTILQGK